MARVLVIDDDREVRTVIQATLEHAGFEVHVVGDGRTGIELVKSENFDLLIVDVFMPGMDGFETIRLVRENKPELPIVVMSGQSFRSGPAPPPDYLSMATKLGAVRSLCKPFRAPELLAMIAECLERSVGGPKIAPMRTAISPTNTSSGS
jgi:CheY-like chemotaxis protein